MGFDSLARTLYPTRTSVPLEVVFLSGTASDLVAAPQDRIALEKVGEVVEFAA